MKSLLASLTNGQKLSIVAAVLLVAGSIYGLLHWSKEKDFRPLYTGLAAEDAGAVVSHLKESGVEYRVNEGGSAILVRSAIVAETRLQMAALGLPKSGRIGFELFDKTNFGVTDFTEQVNYHRALEGELERSVMALAAVESARVHLTFPKNSIFAESRQEAKASVMVKLRTGSQLSPQNVLALTHLVASAVEGLKPEMVSLLDMQGNLLSRPRKTADEGGTEVSDAALDYKQRIEKDLLAKVNTTLEPVLGPDKFRAGVAVDCDFSGGEQSEESFDPNKSVMVTSQKTEDVNGGTVVGGVPGSPSNLPRPASRPVSGSNGVTRKTENITFQTSRTVRHVRIPQGAVKRMSVSVLVDHSVRWEGTGAKARKVVEPPSPEKMKVIHDLVAGVVGLQADRGDQIIVEALPFESTLTAQPPAPQSQPAAPKNDDRLVWGPDLLKQKGVLPIAIGGGVALLLVVFVLVKAMRRGKRGKEIVRAAQGQIAAPGPDDATRSNNARKQLEDKFAEQQVEKERQELEGLAALKLPAVKTQKTEILTKHLATETKKDPMLIAQVIRAWLNER